MNLRQAEEVHRLVRAVFIDGNPAALTEAHPVAVRLIEDTWRALSNSGRRYVNLSEIAAVRPPAADTASPAEHGNESGPCGPARR